MISARNFALICLFFPLPLFADSLSAPVEFDRWMYPFNATPGSRIIGSTFGAINNPVFDDRDAQIVLGFDTNSAAGRAPSEYQISSASVKLTTATDNAFELDPTYDSFSTYLDGDADSDAGRPVELYGVGFRNGYVSGSINDPSAGPPVFGEADPFSLPGPPASGVRFAFASDYKDGVARDVSNNVRDGIDISPWAIGDNAAISPGSSVPIDTELSFNIDLANLDAVQYLQEGLSRGELMFAIASLHTSTQGSAVGIPSFHLTDANGQSLGATAQFDIEYSIVPEPSPRSGIAVAIAAIVFARRQRGK